jgi:hypothetical protein
MRYMSSTGLRTAVNGHADMARHVQTLVSKP